VHWLICYIAYSVLETAYIRDVMRGKMIRGPRGTNDAEPYNRISPLLPVHYNRIFALSLRRISSQSSAIGIFLSTYRHSHRKETQDGKLCRSFLRLVHVSLYALCTSKCRGVQGAYHDNCSVKNIIMLNAAIATLRHEHTGRCA
jgi:hypothetical protein